MTPQQRRFAEEYVVDLNATQAALRAGYSPGCAKTHGTKLLRRPDVAALVAEAQAARAARTQVTADRVVVELAKIAFGNPRRLLTRSGKDMKLRESEELSDAEAALISEITETTHGGTRTRRVKLYCKMTALTALGRHLGLFDGRTKAASGDAGADAGGDAEAHAETDQGGDAREVLARRIAELAARLGTDGSPVAAE